MTLLFSIPNPFPYPSHTHTHTHTPTIPIPIPKPHAQQKNQYDSSRHQKNTQEEGIPIDEVRTLVKFNSRYNHIKVLEVSRKADHPFRGSRLLLLDTPGNIHSINFVHKTLTDTYFDVFATLPPILPPGPIGILGFGAGTAAKLILTLYDTAIVHGWELDPAVVDVGREFFGLGRVEKEFKGRVNVYIGDGFMAEMRDGFSGILVDLFSKGSLVEELGESSTWRTLKGRLKKGGRVMVNVGGSCVEAEDSSRDGRVVMEECLKAMYEVFGKGEVHVLSLGTRKDDSSIALTGRLPDSEKWKMAMPRSLRGYVDMWTPYGR